MTEQAVSPAAASHTATMRTGDARLGDWCSAPTCASQFPQPHAPLSLVSNNIIASCSKTQLSATTTILTTTVAQSSKLRCSDNGCLAIPRLHSSDLARAASTATGEAAPPAIGTCIVAAFGLSATEPQSASTTSSLAVLDDMSVRRTRKRDIILNELAAWKSQFKASFGSFRLHERDSSIEPITVATPTTSTTSHVSQDSAGRGRAGDRTSSTSATSVSSGLATATKPPKTTPVQQQSALTSFHHRVLMRKHHRKQIEDLFVPVDVPPTQLTWSRARTPTIVVHSTGISPAPVRDESSNQSGAKQGGSGNDLVRPTASLTLDNGQGAGGHGDDDDEDKKPHDDDVDGDNVDEEDHESDIEDEEMWNDGYRYWKQLRRQWTSSTSCDDDSSAAQVKAHAVHQIPADLYPRIYHLLVNEGRRLREPVNLSDATKILVAGWMSTGQWPPQPVPPDPLIASRKKQT
ncbi:hypothetical protein POJ06DRAFT_262422 [Lipomyces tetrasporus]|uniref:Gag1-like clamp domain-containing protein n=1 Tax=Lipomyces tetrasporus TaxID=54092 RepID=A0AAD7VQ23_9ASCO|nr:uncharacterized protein POJ06DRAFT_262422 [Lipomyces tetrasporus]KAJ8097059.1 hypothetical protein POJ06DRAFT_262422 [Lipomyces tetrasporus]